MKANRNLIIVINIAAFMVLMDLSAVNIALPTIRHYFNISISTVSFILMASMLTATGSALIMGKIIEILKPEKILITAFTTFAITTTLTAFTNQFLWIIPLRIIQGIAEAALYVIGPALIKKYMKDDRQQRQYGIWMMSCGLGISLGPLFGGIILKYLSWNWIFLINLPLAIIGIFYSLKLKNRLDFKKQNIKFDTKGASYSFLFLAILIIFFNLFSILSISQPILWITAMISLSFLVLFIKHEKAISHPILQLKLYKIINFRLAN
ncbi:MAG: MFS transporter, partial [Bacteroidales bacterium]|nr:MFS transporter [Bacteroidales bacterium]